MHFNTKAGKRSFLLPCFTRTPQMQHEQHACNTASMSVHKWYDARPCFLVEVARHYQAFSCCFAGQAMLDCTSCQPANLQTGGQSHLQSQVLILHFSQMWRQGLQLTEYMFVILAERFKSWKGTVSECVGVCVLFSLPSSFVLRLLHTHIRCVKLDRWLTANSDAQGKPCNHTQFHHRNSDHVHACV